MKTLEQLIQELCPNGVEFKKLGEVCEIKGRIGFRGYTRHDLVKENEGAITLSPSNIKDQELDLSDCSYISWYKYDESPEIQVSIGDIIFTKTASVGKTALIKYLPQKATINPQLVLLKNIQCNAGFLSYFLKTKDFQNAVKRLTGVGSVPNIPQSILASLEVPVPPLTIQEKIVEILDNFTALTAELQAELQARQQQYEYYRNRLLSFGGSDNIHESGADEVDRAAHGSADEGNTLRGGYKHLKMKDLGKFYGGLTGKSKADFTNGNSTFITYMNVFSNLSLKTDVDDRVVINPGEKQNTIQYGDILFTGSSETPEEAGMTSVLTEHVDEDLYLNSFCFGFRLNELDAFNPEFMKHLFRCKYMRKQIIKTANGVTRYNISKKELGEILVPIVPIEEQERIADILDRFEALTNDLTSGLPAEIEARQKQYEYYRNKLLTFERLDA